MLVKAGLAPMLLAGVRNAQTMQLSRATYLLSQWRRLMSKPFKIVVPTDFSDASLVVLDWVKKLCTENEAEVHCVTAVHQPMMYMPMMSGTAMESLPSADQLSRLAQESLNIFAAKHMSDLGAAPIASVLVGRPSSEIIDYAEKIDADIIVIATRGHSRLAHALLGSTAEGVVRDAKCPVLTIRS
jgi:nucleotide-binding universal stress UspA family protein